MRSAPRSVFLVAVATSVLVGGASAAYAERADPRVVVGGAQGVVPSRENAAPGLARTSGPAGSAPLLTWHNGAVSHGVSVSPIYWGTSWSDPAFVGDKRTGLQSFYRGVGGSGYAATNTEYYDSVGNVSTSVTWAGDVVDTAAGPRRAPSTADVFNEVIKATGGQLTAGAYYPVYVDTKRGSAGYCAWHSAGTYNGVSVEFGFFFNLDGDAGCNPGDTATGHSQGLSALANVSGHELSETITDPQLNAWYDRQGAENADKCAWTFSGVSTLTNGSQWLLQGNWSNTAFSAGSGFGPYKACIA